MYESRVLVRSDSCSVDDGRQPSGLIVDERAQRLERHVAALQLPLIILLEQERTDQAGRLGEGAATDAFLRSTIPRASGPRSQLQTLLRESR